VTQPVIDALELRAHPELLAEMRAEPGKHMERRVVALTGVETRAADNGWRGGGLAAVFGDLSHNLGGFRERIDHGAFRKVLASKPDVRALFNHDRTTCSGAQRLARCG
jgi:phage head maturation protease